MISKSDVVKHKQEQICKIYIKLIKKKTIYLFNANNNKKNMVKVKVCF